MSIMSSEQVTVQLCNLPQINRVDKLCADALVCRAKPKPMPAEAPIHPRDWIKLRPPAGYYISNLGRMSWRSFWIFSAGQSVFCDSVLKDFRKGKGWVIHKYTVIFWVVSAESRARTFAGATTNAIALELECDIGDIAATKHRHKILTWPLGFSHHRQHGVSIAEVADGGAQQHQGANEAAHSRHAATN